MLNFPRATLGFVLMSLSAVTGAALGAFGWSCYALAVTIAPPFSLDS